MWSRVPLPAATQPATTKPAITTATAAPPGGAHASGRPAAPSPPGVTSNGPVEPVAAAGAIGGQAAATDRGGHALPDASAPPSEQPRRSANGGTPPERSEAAEPSSGAQPFVGSQSPDDDGDDFGIEASVPFTSDESEDLITEPTSRSDAPMFLAREIVVLSDELSAVQQASMTQLERLGAIEARLGGVEAVANQLKAYRRTLFQDLERVVRDVVGLDEGGSAKLETLDERLRALEALKPRLEALDSFPRAVEAVRQTLSQQVQGIGREVRARDVAIEEAFQRLSFFESRHGLVEVLNDQIQALRQAVQELEHKSADGSPVGDLLAQASVQLAEVEGRLQRLEAMPAQLEAFALAVREELERVTDKSFYLQLDQRLTEVESVAAQLETFGEAVRHEVDRATSAAGARVHEDLTSFEMRLRSLEVYPEQLQAFGETVRDQIQRATEDLVQRDSKLADLDRRVAFVEGLPASLEQRLSALEGLPAILDRRLSALEEVPPQLEQRLASLEALPARLDQRLSSFEAVPGRLEEFSAAVVSELERRDRSFDDRLQHLEMLPAQLEAFGQAIRQEMDRLGAERMTEIDGRLNALERLPSQLEAFGEAVRLEINRAGGDVAERERFLGELSTNLGDLEQRLLALESFPPQFEALRQSLPTYLETWRDGFARQVERAITDFQGRNDSVLGELVERSKVIQGRVDEFESMERRVAPLEALPARIDAEATMVRRQLERIAESRSHDESVVQELIRAKGEAELRDEALARAIEEIVNGSHQLEDRLVSLEVLEKRMASLEMLSAGVERLDSVGRELDDLRVQMQMLDEGRLAPLEALPQKVDSVLRSVAQELDRMDQERAAQEKRIGEALESRDGATEHRLADVIESVTSLSQRMQGLDGLEQRVEPLEAITHTVESLRQELHDEFERMATDLRHERGQELEKATKRVDSVAGRLGPLEALSGHIQLLRRTVARNFEQAMEASRQSQEALARMEGRLGPLEGLSSDFEALDQSLEGRLAALERRLASLEGRRTR